MVRYYNLMVLDVSMGRDLAVGLAGLMAGTGLGYILGREVVTVKPRFKPIIDRYSIVAEWMGNRYMLEAVFLPQDISGDEIWLWLAPDKGVWAITKMWEKAEGISFEIARTAWARMKIYRENILVAEFPEVTMSGEEFIGYWSTTETIGRAAARLRL